METFLKTCDKPKKVSNVKVFRSYDNDIELSIPDNCILQHDLEEPQLINCIRIKEAIKNANFKGGAVRHFHIDAFDGIDWLCVYRGDIIESYRICVIKEIKTLSIRLVIDDAVSPVFIEDFCGYLQKPIVKQTPFMRLGYIHPNAFTYNHPFDPDQMDALTHVVFIGHTFWKKDEHGNLIFFADKESDEYVQRLKNVIGRRSTKILLALVNYCDLAEFDNSDKRANMLQDVLEFVDKHDFDGVDIDYEYPETEKSWKVYDEFLLDLSKELKKRNKSLSIAVGSWNHHLGTESSNVIDFFNIMNYDSGFYYSNWHSTYSFAVDDINALSEMGIPREKANLGVPFYGEYFDENCRNCGDCINYDKIVEQCGSIKPHDNIYKTYYYNGVNMIQDKTMLAIESGCRGIMIWQIAGDVPFASRYSLLKAIDNTVQKFCPPLFTEK